VDDVMFAHDVPGRGSKLRHLLRITYQEATLDWSQSLIFVITLLSNETEVITVVVLFSKRLLKCSQINSPRDMAASSIHRCLYIMEVGHSPESIVCLNAATGELHKQWHITDEGRNLAVDQCTGNVVLMCAKEIVEYDHNGQMIRTVLMPGDGMDMLWQAVPVRHNQFVISQVGCDINFCTIV